MKALTTRHAPPIWATSRENAVRLGRFIEEKRSEISRNATAKIQRLREEATPHALAEAQEIEDWLANGYRFDIVAHSMGGLVARYYLRYGATDLPEDGSLPPVTWAGAQEVDRLILVGTPNLGSMDALKNLVLGFNPSFLLPKFHPTLLATMPSVRVTSSRRLSDDRRMVEACRLLASYAETCPRVIEKIQWSYLNPKKSRYRVWVQAEAPGQDWIEISFFNLYFLVVIYYRIIWKYTNNFF